MRPQALQRSHGVSTHPLRGEQLARWLSPRRLIVLASIAAVLIYASSVAVLPRRYGHIVVGDGVHYYVYLRSLVHDHDLDFTNEYTEFNQDNTTDPTKRVNVERRTPTGLVLNMFSIGPALVALPLYLLAHVLSLLGSAAGLPLRTDGYGVLYEGAFAVTGVLASGAGAAFAYAALRRLIQPGPALAGVAGIWLGSSLLYYTIASPVYAHAFSALGVAAWFFVWTRLTTSRPLPWFGMGLIGGLMATMRWQEGLFALLPLLLWLTDVVTGRGANPGLLERADAAPERAVLRPGVLVAPVAYGLGLLLGFAPQMLAWTVLYGAPLAVPQGSSFFTWNDPHWLDVLISSRNGLFTWHPVTLMAVVGLLALLPRYPRWAAVALLGIVLQVLINGLVSDWWAGAAFGARRFNGLAVFFSLGLGWLIQMVWPQRRALTLAALAVLIALNGLLLVQFSAFLKGWTTMDTYPTLRQMTIERVTWPLAFIAQRRQRS